MKPNELLHLVRQLLVSMIGSACLTSCLLVVMFFVLCSTSGQLPIGPAVVLVICW